MQQWKGWRICLTVDVTSKGKLIKRLTTGLQFFFHLFLWLDTGMSNKPCVGRNYIYSCCPDVFLLRNFVTLYPNSFRLHRVFTIYLFWAFAFQHLASNKSPQVRLRVPFKFWTNTQVLEAEMLPELVSLDSPWISCHILRAVVIRVCSSIMKPSVRGEDQIHSENTAAQNFIRKTSYLWVLIRTSCCMRAKEHTSA